MKVLVTGVAGFIGSHTAETFRRSGATIVGIDNLSRTGARVNLDRLQRNGQIDFVQLDIREAEGLNRTFAANRDADLVIHAAGQVAVTTSVQDPLMDFEINALGTLNVLEAVRHHCPETPLIFTSTNKVYGGLDDLKVVERDSRYAFAAAPHGVAEDQPLDFHSPYGCSKGSADQYVRDYSRIFGLRTVVLRQSCIYGTHQFGVEDQGWVAWFAIAGVLGWPVTIYGDGRQVRDVLWFEDLMDLFQKVLQSIDVAAGQIYNVGGGPHTLSLLELISELEAILGHTIEPRWTDWRPGDQRIYVSDTRRIERDLGWQPTTTPKEGVVKLVEWASSNRAQLNSLLGSAPKRAG